MWTLTEWKCSYFLVPAQFWLRLRLCSCCWILDFHCQHFLHKRTLTLEIGIPTGKVCKSVCILQCLCFTAPSMKEEFCALWSDGLQSGILQLCPRLEIPLHIQVYVMPCTCPCRLSWWFPYTYIQNILIRHHDWQKHWFSLCLGSLLLFPLVSLVKSLLWAADNYWIILKLSHCSEIFSGTGVP